MEMQTIWRGGTEGAESEAEGALCFVSLNLNYSWEGDPSHGRKLILEEIKHTLLENQVQAMRTIPLSLALTFAFSFPCLLTPFVTHKHTHTHEGQISRPNQR